MATMLMLVMTMMMVVMMMVMMVMLMMTMKMLAAAGSRCWGGACFLDGDAKLPRIDVDGSMIKKEFRRIVADENV